MSDQAKRACKASAILGVGFVLLALSACFSGEGVFEKASHVAQSVTTGVAVLQDASGDSTQEESDASDERLVEHLFAAAGGAVERQDVVPNAFARECFDPDALGASQVAYRKGIVGLSCNSSPEEAGTTCIQEMTLHGWNVASKSASETACLYTFLKQSGSYSWAYLLCQPAGGSTSVVMLVKEA